jgi:plasmid maintenance system antidote protein VapI
MNPTIKPRFDRVKAMAIQKTAKAFGVTDNYVRQIVRGERSEEDIMRYYRESYFELEKAMNP